MDHAHEQARFLDSRLGSNGRSDRLRRRPLRWRRVGLTQDAKAPPADEYPRTRPGSGGPVGSPTDRGKLVPGLRKPGLPPVAGRDARTCPSSPGPSATAPRSST